MPAPEQTQMTAAGKRATAWAGVALAAITVLGLLFAPGLLLIWIVLLVFAIAAVPQAFLIGRRERRVAADRARARRALDIAGAMAAIVAIAGLIFARSLIVLWAFLLLFGVTKVPERLIRHLRERRRR